MDGAMALALSPQPEMRADGKPFELTPAQRQQLAAKGQPLWWLDKLSRRLIQKRRRTKIFWDYYHGNHRLLFATAKFREAFGGLFNEFADNWCRPPIEALNGRIDLTGFRIDPKSEGDDDAWEFWQANRMDWRSGLAHEGALVGEESAAGVWYGQEDRSIPQITVMDPNEVTVAVAGDGVTRLAALRMWTDLNDGQVYANVYLPDAIWKFIAGSSVSNDLTIAEFAAYQDHPGGGAGAPNFGGLWLPPGYIEERGGWLPNKVRGEAWPLPNPVGKVNVVPLVNRAKINGFGESEIRDIVPLQDAVNKTLMDGQINSEFTAFPQRWMIGSVPRDAQGNPKEPFDFAANRVWYHEDTEGSFGDFRQGDNAGLVKWIEMLIGHIASQSGTPAHYFTGLTSTQFPSGDALRAAEAPLTSKARKKQRQFAEPWLEVIRLAFLYSGRKKDLKKASIMTSEVLWADPEYRSESEHMDAISKSQGIGVPQRILWEMAGLTPAQIARIPDLLKEQAKLQAELQKLLPTPPAGTPAAPQNAVVLPALPGAPAAAEVRGDRVST